MLEDNLNNNDALSWNGIVPSPIDNELDLTSDELWFLQDLESSAAVTLLAIAIASEEKTENFNSNGTILLRQSHMLNASTNLLFGEINGEDFLISQHVTSCDFIYFPKLNKVKIFCHADIATVVGILEQLGRVKKALGGHAQFGFGGVIASHGRPSHYFYDTILGVLEASTFLENAGLKRKIPLCQISHYDFADLEFFVNSIFQYKFNSIDFNALNSNGLMKKQFWLKIGSFYDYGNDYKKNLLSKFDALFLKEVTNSESNTYERIREIRKEGYFIIWHGITTQKRRWVEQSEAIINLANILNSNGVKLCIVVDGWTCPLTPTATDEQQVVSDSVVYTEIKQGVHIDIKTVNLIGKTPVEKLATASLCDFHITNGGTGSIYTSRMAKVPGILHISNKAKRMTGQSIHHNSVFLPSSCVVDIEVDGQRDDFVSYSIEKNLFTRFALQQLFTLFDMKLATLDIGYTVNCKHSLGTDIYESITDDPIVIFNQSSIFSNYEGDVEVKISVDTPLNYGALTPKIYFDVGDGYSEHLSFTSKYDPAGEVSFNVSIGKNLKSIRFDPFSCKGEFGINYVLIRLS